MDYYLSNSYLFDSNFLICVKYSLILFVFNLCITSCNSSKNKDILSENISYLRNSHILFNKLQNNDYLKTILESIQNSSVPFDLIQAEKFLEQIYGKIAGDELTRNQQLTQMSSWLSGEESVKSFNQTSYLKDAIEKYMQNLKDSRMNGDYATPQALRAERFKNQISVSQQLSSPNIKPIDSQSTQSIASIHKSDENEEKHDSVAHNYDSSYEEDDGKSGPSGTTKAPACAHYGRYYCSYKEDYPTKVVTEVTKYYKWPLEKLFRDLRQQVMPTLANDNSGGLVCDSITRIIRPGWSKNTNGRWLVVINTDHYQQYVTEVICRHGTGSYCNFIPPCYHSSCRQRYNTQKLLVIDPWNPYKGPFLSEFLFPSCCVCWIPGENSEGSQPTHSPSNRDKLTASHSTHQIQSSASVTPLDTSAITPT